MKKTYLFFIMLVLSLSLFVSGVIGNSNSNHDKTIPDISVKKQATNADDVIKDENNKQQETSCKDTKEIARSGCCSWHNGVCGCDQASGMIRCCDGTLSPSCTCSGY